MMRKNLICPVITACLAILGATGCTSVLEVVDLPAINRGAQQAGRETPSDDIEPNKESSGDGALEAASGGEIATTINPSNPQDSSNTSQGDVSTTTFAQEGQSSQTEEIRSQGELAAEGDFPTTASPVAVSQDTPTSRRITTSGGQVQINQIETSQFPKVVVFATVLKDGVPVPGLTAQDFRVREDEVDQEPLTVVPQLTPLSAVLTLDTSGSMKDRLADAQAAAKSFLTRLQPQDKVQVIRFSRDVKTTYPLGADRGAAGGAIDKTVARGDTALWDALYASVESLRTVSGRKAILLLSDGVDDDGTGQPLSKRTVADVLALARQVNVPIYTIGLGTELDEPALRRVASETGALYLNAAEAGELRQLYDSVGMQLAGQYAISYTSNLPADGLEHRVQLTAGGDTSVKSYVPAATTAVTPAVEQPVAIASEGSVPTKELFLAPGQVKFRAKLGPETPFITKGYQMWRIFQGPADLNGNRQQIAQSGSSAQPVFTLKEGDYKVRVGYGAVSHWVDLTVRDGHPSEGTVILGAGQVKLRGQLGPETPFITKGYQMWRIFQGPADLNGNRRQIAQSGSSAQPIFTLREGDYKAQVQLGSVVRTVDLSLKTGEQKRMDIVIGAGQVKFKARQEPGAPFITKGYQMWRIFQGPADLNGNRQQIAQSGTSAQPVFTLREGSYKARVQFDGKSRTVDFTVRSGDQKVVEVDLSAGQ